MQRPGGMREKGAFGELQMVQPGWEFERGMKLEVMERTGGMWGRDAQRSLLLWKPRGQTTWYFTSISSTKGPQGLPAGVGVKAFGSFELVKERGHASSVWGSFFKSLSFFLKNKLSPSHTIWLFAPLAPIQPPTNTLSCCLLPR